jgi:hypothetical protein
MAEKAKSTKASGEFKCPECGRTFTRAAALGAHRRQAHGVVGAVSAARSRRGRATGSRAGRTRSKSAAPARRKTAAAKTKTAAAKAKAAAAKTASRSARTARRTSQTARAQPATRTRSATQGSSTPRRRDSSDAVNRDALLAALFPNGLPAKEDVLRAANQWLNDAERLARMR